jgi:flagellar protein FlgJ
LPPNSTAKTMNIGFSAQRLPSSTSLASKPEPSAEVAAAARAFEGMFVAEMLSQAGLGANNGEFGGGEGEAAFSSFLTRAYADSIAASGRFGLSEAIVRALSAPAVPHD